MRLTSSASATSWLYKNNSLVFKYLLALKVVEKRFPFVFNSLLASFVKFSFAEFVEIALPQVTAQGADWLETAATTAVRREGRDAQSAPLTPQYVRVICVAYEPS